MTTPKLERAAIDIATLPAGYGLDGRRHAGFCDRCGHNGYDCHCSVENYRRFMDSIAYNRRVEEHAMELMATLASLLQCCELNLDEMEESTIEEIERANALIEEIETGKTK